MDPRPILQCAVGGLARPGRQAAAVRLRDGERQIRCREPAPSPGEPGGGRRGRRDLRRHGPAGGWTAPDRGRSRHRLRPRNSSRASSRIASSWIPARVSGPIRPIGSTSSGPAASRRARASSSSSRRSLACRRRPSRSWAMGRRCPRWSPRRRGSVSRGASRGRSCRRPRPVHGPSRRGGPVRGVVRLGGLSEGRPGRDGRRPAGRRPASRHARRARRGRPDRAIRTKAPSELADAVKRPFDGRVDPQALRASGTAFARRHTRSAEAARLVDRLRGWFPDLPWGAP